MNKLPKILVILGILVVLLALATAVLAQGSLPTFTKSVSNTTPTLGDVFTVTLDFNNTYTQTRNVRVTDPNPAPAFLTINPASITGGAVYSSAINGVVWEGNLPPNGTLPQRVTFQMSVTSLPANIGTGHLITNTATMIIFPAGSLPDQTALATFRLVPIKVYLPIIVK